jgi:hypothetical protein
MSPLYPSLSRIELVDSPVFKRANINSYCLCEFPMVAVIKYRSLSTFFLTNLDARSPRPICWQGFSLWGPSLACPWPTLPYSLRWSSLCVSLCLVVHLMRTAALLK